MPVSLRVGYFCSGFRVRKSVILTVRVQDTNRVLAANPANDDVRIGTYHGKSPFIPGRVSGRDATGKTMRLAVPPGQPLSVWVSSSAYTLTDDKGNKFGPGETEIPVPGSAVPSLGGSSPPPVFTVHMTSKN